MMPKAPIKNGMCDAAKTDVAESTEAADEPKDAEESGGEE